MATVNEETREDRWKRALVGKLPPDFLRIATPRELQEAADCQAAMALYQQQALSSYVAPNIVGRLSITVAQAKLVRNYGLTRMDPYVRLRVGHFVYETQTDPNGGKAPHWNRVVHSQLPAGVNKISVEIYDECSFKMDELIAWAEIPITEKVLRGETVEDWYLLSGKQGDGLEGSIDIVLSFTTQSVVYTPQIAPAPVVMVPNVSGPPMPVFVAPQQQIQPMQLQQQHQQLQHQQPPVQPQVLRISEDDFKQVQEMFPNIDPEVIKSVFEANRGNKDKTINSLLQMTD